MAHGVTLNVPELMGALRMTDSDEERAQADRLLDVASVMVEKHAPGAPEIILNELFSGLASLADRGVASRRLLWPPWLDGYPPKRQDRSLTKAAVLPDICCQHRKTVRTLQSNCCDLT